MNLKLIVISFVFSFSYAGIQAQDIVTKADGGYVRGEVKRVGLQSVLIDIENVGLKELPAKDVVDVFWNGETYEKKVFFDTRIPEERFAKLISDGAINFYAIGFAPPVPGTPASAQKSQKPRISIGMGSGNAGGMGGGISFGGRPYPENQQIRQAPQVLFYIEKPGKSGIRRVPCGSPTPQTQKKAVKSLLQNNMNDDPDFLKKN